MRLLTYNIHGCIGVDRKYDPERILYIINEVDADIVALQEVYSAQNFLGELEGYSILDGPTLNRNGGSYGNVLLTRYPVTSSETIDLRVRKREPRGAIRAVLDDNVEVVATHLGLTTKERMLQMEMLSQSSAAEVDLRILAGDLNDWYGNRRFARFLSSRYKSFPYKSPRTFPTTLPMFRLDRIITDTPERLVKLIVPDTKYTRVASDHLPLVGEFR